MTDIEKQLLKTVEDVNAAYLTALQWAEIDRRLDAADDEEGN